MASTTSTSPRLYAKYTSDSIPALMKKFGYTNPMQVPRLKTIVVNMGVGEAVANPKLIDSAVVEMTAITGQKPVVTRAKRSIAQFKIREGMPIGVMVTLRGARMYEFVDRLFNIALPRVRDFRGLSPDAFDGHGNYTLGLKEQLIFPEIEYDKIDRVRGMEISFVTSARNDAEGRRLLEMLGMPYSRPQGQAGGVQRIAS